MDETSTEELMADIKKLGGTALRAYFRIAHLWKLGLREQWCLLGKPPLLSFLLWKLTGTGTPGAGVILRISYILGIYKALQILLPVPSSADTWMRRPNTAPLFGGCSALEFVLREGTSGLHSVRAYLDTAVQGFG